MYKKSTLNSLILSLSLIAGLLSADTKAALRIGPPPKREGNTVAILQINDVYEIAPTRGGKEGGLARVATLQKRLRETYPHLFSVLAGDFLGPSVLGSQYIGGLKIAGQQMISTLNTMGLDFAILGNHEFDVTRSQLQRRILESKFQWLAGNVKTPDDLAFAGLPISGSFEAVLDSGRQVKIGIPALTINSNQHSWVCYDDYALSMKTQVEALAPKSDAIVALTHLPLADDLSVADQVPGIDLILGGHEHENLFKRSPVRNVPIAKADSNARTVYLHKLIFPPFAGAKPRIESELIAIDESLTEDPATAAVALEFGDRVEQELLKTGIDLYHVIANVPIALDGREEVIREQASPLTDLITEALLMTFPEAQIGLINAGAIRIEDFLPAGPVTEFDVMRIIPYANKVVLTQIRGGDLQILKKESDFKKGSGDYMHFSGLDIDSLESNTFYWVSTIDFEFAELVKSGLILKKSKITPALQTKLIELIQKKWNPSKVELPRAPGHEKIKGQSDPH